jgi:hypothetical protein
VRGVDQVDAQLDGPPGHHDRRFAVRAGCGGQVHGPEAETPYAAVAADAESGRFHR